MSLPNNAHSAPSKNARLPWAFDTAAVHKTLDEFFKTNVAKEMKNPIDQFKYVREIVVHRFWSSIELRRAMIAHDQFRALLDNAMVREAISEEKKAAWAKTASMQSNHTKQAVDAVVARKKIAHVRPNLEQRGDRALKTAFAKGNIKAIEKITEILWRPIEHMQLSDTNETRNETRNEIRASKIATSIQPSTWEEPAKKPLGDSISMDQAKKKLHESFQRDAVFQEASWFVILQNGDVVDFPELHRIAGQIEVNAFRIVQITSIAYAEDDKKHDYKYEITCLARWIYQDPDSKGNYKFFDNEELKIRVPREWVSVGWRLRVFHDNTSFFEARIGSKLKVINNTGEWFYSKYLPKSLQPNGRFIR